MTMSDSREIGTSRQQDFTDALKGPLHEWNSTSLFAQQDGRVAHGEVFGIKDLADDRLGRLFLGGFISDDLPCRRDRHNNRRRHGYECLHHESVPFLRASVLVDRTLYSPRQETSHTTGHTISTLLFSRSYRKN